MTIAVVGIGLDGKAGLAQNIREIITQATVLSGSKRHLSYFADLDVKKLELTNLDRGLEAIAELELDGQAIVILASGDPLFFGLGRLLLSKFKPKDLCFYPHQSSIQLAFSSIKIPWQDADLVSVHGRSIDNLTKLFKQAKEKIAVLTDSYNNPSAIARLFLALELPVSYSFYICENLGGDNETTTHYPPAQLNKLCQLETEFAALNVLILIREKQENDLDLASLPLIGLPDSSFLSFSDRPSLITKKEVRLAILGELALQPKQTVWDIGAGTGSVSIEIARLCPTSQVLAIEKTSMGSNLVIQNSQRFQVDNIISINGKAPDVLEDLPNCDRVFMGGSGGNIIDILHTCSQKLNPAGIIVMSFATLEYQIQAISWLTENAWQYKLLQLQISRSTPIARLTRMTPLNPVTVITAWR